MEVMWVYIGCELVLTTIKREASTADAVGHPPHCAADVGSIGAVVCRAETVRAMCTTREMEYLECPCIQAQCLCCGASETVRVVFKQHSPVWQPQGSDTGAQRNATKFHAMAVGERKLLHTIHLELG